jgi:hypothetical protein
MGEPLGDSATYRKADGGLVLGGGGGGSAPANTTSTTTQTSELPEWARGYAKDTLAKGAALTDINQNPYQQYSNDRIAGFSPMQQQAMQGAQNMQPSQQLNMGSGLATAAGIGGLNAQYGGEQFGNTYQGVPMYNAGRFNQQRVGTQQFTGDQVGQYMNPYLQNALDPQLQEIQRQYGITGAQQQSAATQAGAFGGSREAIMAAENERNKNTAMNQVIGQGFNTAYSNAQNQFNQSQQQRLQAQQANQQTNLATQQAQQQANQFGYGQLANQAQNYAQYGQAANQLNAQQQQFGANLGLQGLQQANQAATTLGQLGQNQYGQQMGINQLQAQYGGQQQALQQQGLTQSYQDFVNQQNYPYKQLGFMSDMIRGLPLGQQSTAAVYQPPGSVAGQIAGLGVGALGLAGLGKQAGVFAEGGEVKGYADGGPMNDPYEMASSVDTLTDEQLQAILQRPSSPAEFRAAQDEMAMRASEKQGVASMVPPYMSDDIVSAAGGGILAFKDEGFVKSPEKETSSIGDLFRAIGGEKAINAIREKYYQIGERENEISAAEDVYPGIFEAMTPTERARRKAAGDRLFKGSQSVAPLSQEALAQKRDQFQKEAVANAVKYDPSTATRLSDFQPQLKTNTAGGTGGTKVGGGAGRGAGGKDDFESEMAKIKEFFKDPEAEAANKRMEEMLGKREGKADDAKQRAFYGFLANAGANIAQAASKPGKQPGIRGILQSTSEAAPASMQFANEAQKGIDALEDTNLKLNLEYQKLKIAERKNDKTAMLSAYQNIRMLKQHEATLAETVRHNQATEGLTGQHYAALKGQYANKSMAPYINAYGRAEDRAIQATNGYMKTPAGAMDKRPYSEIVEEFAKKYRKNAGASIGFGPTGNIYDTDEDS